MSLHHNTTAYSGFENLANFTDETFKNYCEAKLDGCREKIELIRNHCVGPDWTGKVCEIGSGNSKLLYALEQSGILQAGIGLEISASRHAFAEKFKDWIGSTKTKNLNVNVLEIEPLTGCDLVCGIDTVLQMITPVSDDATTKLFSWINQSLKPGGHLIAELRNFQRFIQIMNLLQDRTYQFWEEFPTPDPWRYNLNRLTFVDEKQTDLCWEKNFLRRGSQETSRSFCTFRHSTPESFTRILVEHGFGDFITITTKTDVFMVIARKTGK